MVMMIMATISMINECCGDILSTTPWWYIPNNHDQNSGFSELDSEEDLSKVLDSGEILIKSRQQNQGYLRKFSPFWRNCRYSRTEVMHVMPGISCSLFVQHSWWQIAFSICYNIYEFEAGEDRRVGYFCKLKGNITLLSFCRASPQRLRGEKVAL